LNLPEIGRNETCKLHLNIQSDFFHNYALEQGYSIILGKGPVTNIKIFRSPVTSIKSWKCDMSWIFLTKNIA